MSNIAQLTICINLDSPTEVRLMENLKKLKIEKMKAILLKMNYVNNDLTNIPNNYNIKYISENIQELSLLVEDIQTLNAIQSELEEPQE